MARTGTRKKEVLGQKGMKLLFGFVFGMFIFMMLPSIVNIISDMFAGMI